MMRGRALLVGTLALLSVVGVGMAYTFGVNSRRIPAPVQAHTEVSAGMREVEEKFMRMPDGTWIPRLTAVPSPQMAYPVAQELIMGAPGGPYSIGPEVAPDLPGTYVDFPKQSVKLRIPEWWRPIDESIFSRTPYFFTDVRAAFLRDNSSCALLYSGNAGVPYTRAHEINSVIVGSVPNELGTGTHLLTERNILTRYVPPNPGTTTPGIVPFSSGMHEPYWPFEFVRVWQGGTDPTGFHLVSTDGTPLTAECESEMRSIVQTMTRSFETGVLPADDTGGIVIASGGVGTNNAPMYIFVPKYPASLDEGFLVIQVLPSDSEQFVFSEKDQSIYFVRNTDKPAIYRLSLHIDASDIPPQKVVDELLVPSGEIITSFLIRGATVYYLTGLPTCHEYKGSCTTELRMQSLGGGDSRLVASDLERSSVVGLSPDSSTILLATHFGDGGCWSSTYDKVLLVGGVVTSVGTFSGCHDDAGAGRDPSEERGRRELVSQYDVPDPATTWGLAYEKDHSKAFIESESIPWEDRITAQLISRYQLSPFPIQRMQ